MNLLNWKVWISVSLAAAISIYGLSERGNYYKKKAEEASEKIIVEKIKNEQEKYKKESKQLLQGTEDELERIRNEMESNGTSDTTGYSYE